jgi:DNA-binding NarL/FixJ family response regulator
MLADDHAIVRSGLRALLDREPGIEVIAEAGNGRDAIRVAHEKIPDIIVMDISMPVMNGIEATLRITSEMAGVKVLCLSMHAERHFVSGMLQAGATGYLTKDCASEELVRAIGAVMAQQTYISPAVASSLVEGLRVQTHGRCPAESLLTRREREVLELLAEGHSTKQIAARLHRSIKTVGTHREHLMQKLAVDNVAGLIRYAIRHGLTTATS